MRAARFRSLSARPIWAAFVRSLDGLRRRITRRAPRLDFRCSPLLRTCLRSVMTAIAPLLVELLTEELPPRALARLADAFAQGMVERLNARALIGAADRAPVFERHATPRRLAVVVHAVRAHAPPQRTRLKVLPVSIALDAHSRPTPVLSKKLAALGMEQW